MNVTEWAERIVAMLDDSDPGVTLTVASLITAMAQRDLDAFSGCYQRAVNKLDRVGDAAQR
jgi:AP-2 complex subunit alpha